MGVAIISMNDVEDLKGSGHSIQNRTSGQEHIFVCLIDVPMGLNAQSYSTLELGAWTLDII